MRERKKRREAAEIDEDGEVAKKRRVRFVNDEEEVLNSDDEVDEVDGTDSDEIIYDSEEEDEAER